MLYKNIELSNDKGILINLYKTNENLTPERITERLKIAGTELINTLKDKGLIQVYFDEYDTDKIRISGMHEDIIGYRFGHDKITISDDLNDLDAGIKAFIEMWHKWTTPEYKEIYENFIREGEATDWN